MAEPETYWPETLPDLVEKQGFDYPFPNRVLRSTVDKGPARQRRYTSAAKRRMTCPIVFTTEELETLEEFLDVADGQSFWFPDPLDETRYLLVDIVPQSTESSVPLVPNGQDWLATFTFEVWPHVSRNRT